MQYDSLRPARFQATLTVILRGDYEPLCTHGPPVGHPVWPCVDPSQRSDIILLDIGFLNGSAGAARPLPSPADNPERSAVRRLPGAHWAEIDVEVLEPLAGEPARGTAARMPLAHISV